MKIRFWTKRSNSILLVLLVLPISTVIVNYLQGEKTDYIIFLPGLLICLVFFLPNYFRYMLEQTDSKLLIREGVFKRGVSIDMGNIKSIRQSKLNNEPISIVFELIEGNEITWNTRERSKEMHERLISLNAEWRRNEQT